MSTSLKTEDSHQFVVSLAYKVVAIWYHVVAFLEKLPGGALVINYIKASHKNDPWRTLLEILLALLAIKYFLASRYSQDESEKMVLSNRDIDELIEEWEPEPLVQELRDDERWQLKSIPKIKGAIATRVNLFDQNDDSKIIPNVLNVASEDFLSVSVNEIVKSESIKCIREVGVGACGPPNFYGTQSVHIRLREDLASFLGAEASIIYGQDYSTITSVLPCFLKRGDIVILDGGVGVALQKAALISRCDIEWFNHNDLGHLESILESLQEDLADGPLNRRFIVTEGLSENFGDSPDLKRLVEIKNKYKFRLILDESNSIGTLGQNGRGLPEVFNIPRKEIEITIGSMAKAFGSSGGFCVGYHDMIYHQVLNSNAYVFSAALPPYSAVAVSTIIRMLEDNEEADEVNPIIKPLQINNQYLYDLFSKSNALKNYVCVRSASYSPTLHLRINPELRHQLDLPESYGGPGSVISKAVKNGNEEAFFDPLYNLESLMLQKVIDQCIDSNVLLTRTKRILHHELLPVVPELILNSNSAFTKSEIDFAYNVVEKSIINVLDCWKSSSK